MTNCYSYSGYEGASTAARICHLSFVICYLSLVICHWSFVICHLGIGHLSFGKEI
ncbi:MAG: hypothetical protein F6K31_33740 [Symploca sp. SIO2G7]|nr:hypothetical protein [Symploca sp. SIO2G7]